MAARYFARIMAPKEMRIVLTVTDLDRAVALFREGLGLPQLAEFRNDGGHAVLLDAGRATLELFDEAQAAAVDAIEVGRRVAGPVRLAFQVDDGDAASAVLVSAGAELIAGPVVTPWGDRNVRLTGPGTVQLTLFSSGEA